MTHEQIEKAAQEFWDDWLLVQQKADEYSALEIPFDEADEMYRLWKEGLTRFAQQCEADALERAANEIWRDNRRSDDLAGFRQHSLQWEAGHTDTLESLRSRAAAIRNGLSTTKQEG